jgi:transcription elongation factor GreA
MPKFLTPEGIKKIEKEIIDLKKEKPLISERIRNAKELGDLSENSEYTTSKEDLARTNSRIKELENLLKTAEVVDNREKNDSISIGSEIIIEINGASKEYKLVGSEESDPSQGLLSYQSPFGEALLGKKIGEQVEIQTPKGKIQATIKQIQ